ncbi:hypothetical protein [Tenacibaculum salmonis]|uniref:hypothetical protein n=1 Tax=Tenacibaculum sp. P3-BQ1 TaxID=3232310 RepID=UPI0034DEA10D
MEINKLFLAATCAVLFLTSCTEEKLETVGGSTKNSQVVFSYKDEGRTKEMLNYTQIIDVLKLYDVTRITPIEESLGYEDSRINTFNFIQFKKYLGHIENLSAKSGIEITGISFIATAKKLDNVKNKGYGSLIYLPSTTVNGKQFLFDPEQSFKQKKLVTFKEMLAKHGYNWIYDSKESYSKGKRRDCNYTIELEEGVLNRGEEGQAGSQGEQSGAGNLTHIKPPYLDQGEQ